MSIVSLDQGRGFSIERSVIRVGRALVAWGERRERIDHGRIDLYRRQAEAREQQALQEAAARIHLLP